MWLEEEGTLEEADIERRWSTQLGKEGGLLGTQCWKEGELGVMGQQKALYKKSWLLEWGKTSVWVFCLFVSPTPSVLGFCQKS